MKGFTPLLWVVDKAVVWDRVNGVVEQLGEGVELYRGVPVAYNDLGGVGGTDTCRVFVLEAPPPGRQLPRVVFSVVQRFLRRRSCICGPTGAVLTNAAASARGSVP
ncbi:MAG: hypothetical protein ACO2PN_13380 [Pyrobaculum sp.]